MRARLSERVITERVAELERDSNVKRVLYRKARGTDVRVPYAYVRFQLAPISCRHRDDAGHLCGDAWELVMYNLHTGKVIGAKCYVSGHQRVLNPRRVIAQFKRWYKGLGVKDKDVARLSMQLAGKLKGAQRYDA